MSPVHGIETLEEQRLSIDLDIAKHEACIQELKFRRNATVPISRLPPEIFCRVFEFICEGDGYRGLLWIQLTHVSRHWRNVAASCPSLWTKPPLWHLHWTD